jgi:PAS domain S-box-containing protein
MDTEFPLLTPQQTVQAALNVLVDWRVPAAPVVNEERYLGSFVLDEQVVQNLLNSRHRNNPPLVADFMKISISVAREEQKISEIPLTQSPMIPVINTEGQLSGILWIDKIASIKTVSHEEFNTIFESSNDGIAICDGEGIILRVNRATERILGCAFQELVNKNVRELVDLGIIIHSATEEVISTNKPASIKQTNAFGKKFIASGTPIFNQDGRIYRIVTTLKDITELEELHKTLANTRVQVAEFSSDQVEMRNLIMHKNGLISKSPLMLKIIDLAIKVSRSDATVLILGESGVGKELIAKLIHTTSGRGKSGHFIKVNCGAIPRELLESEFFGYKPGAFTGANKEGKIGYFESAHQGTLFLDEIGELALDLQVKLLRVIQEHELVRLGDTKAQKIDVRIITATNRELHTMVINKTFREDLFYRLNVLPLQIPPLRSRQEDIPALLTAFLEKYSQKYGTGKMFSGDSLTLLCKYNWPGNVRELENLVERLVLTTDEHVILPLHLPMQVYQAGKPTIESAITLLDNENQVIPEQNGEMRTLQEVIDSVEKEMIIKALQIYGSTYRAARVLGVSQSTISRKTKKYNQINERYWREETDD